MKEDLLVYSKEYPDVPKQRIYFYGVVIACFFYALFCISFGIKKSTESALIHGFIFSALLILLIGKGSVSIHSLIYNTLKRGTIYLLAYNNSYTCMYKAGQKEAIILNSPVFGFSYSKAGCTITVNDIKFVCREKHGKEFESALKRRQIKEQAHYNATQNIGAH